MNEYILKAERFLESCVFDGLAHSWDVVEKRYVKPYPEVTGYAIKYFCDHYSSIPENIVRAADHLVELQDSQMGGIRSFEESHILYAFDTAQVLIGLCAIYSKTENDKYLKSALFAGDFLLASQEQNGAFKPIYNKAIEAWVIRDETYNLWNGPYSGLMCKLTEGLECLYKYSGDTKYKFSKEKAASFYQNAKYIEYTHPLGYWLEGCYEAGKKELVKKVIEEKVLKRIHSNGYIAYKEDLPYAYVSGVIQLGIILYKMEYEEYALKIRNYGRLVQSHHISGGLFQYASKEGVLDHHVHTEINSWGTKYFCELERLCEGKQ